MKLVRNVSKKTWLRRQLHKLAEQINEALAHGDAIAYNAAMVRIAEIKERAK